MRRLTRTHAAGFRPRLGGTPLLLVVSMAGAACGPSDADRARAGGPDDASAAWVELVLAERDFDLASGRSGTKEAFLQNISDSGILFRPVPVDGRALLEEGPDPGGSLRWAPEVAHVSADGAVGFTSGPFRSLQEGASEPQTGRYVTVWRRRADGSFAFEVDVGVMGPGPGSFPQSVRALGPTYRWSSPGMPDEGGLVGLDETLQLRYAQGAAGLANLPIHPHVWVLRDGRLPEEGPAALGAAADRGAALGGITWQARGARFADDGSLGYVYGMAAPPGPEGPGSGFAAPFLRIWVRGEDGGWQLLLDLLGVPGA